MQPLILSRPITPHKPISANKQNKDKRQQPRKIVLNSTFGASKDVYNKLYDPLQANNICITGQLLLTDLIEKLENHCQLIQLT